MRITPLDLQNHHFRRRLAGYAPDEVDEFLRLVADDYAAALREIEAQRAEIAKLGQRVEDLVANEDVLQETLTTAQKLAEELKRTAMKEAEVKSEKVLEAAHRRAAKLAQDISEMKNLKLRLAASVRAVIETHLELVDGLAKDRPEDPELEGMVAYLTGAPREPRGSREP